MMKNKPKVSMNKISKGYLYTGIFLILFLQTNYTVALAEEEILNPINPSESVTPKNPEHIQLPEEATVTSPEKKQIEKNEETKQVPQPHVNQQKQLKESKAVVKKDDFFRPVERVVLNKKTHSTAGSNEDARVGKTNTGMMLAALSGKMLFGIDG